MAKSSKLEDYWKQHNIESLFKDLTHTLVQRMPPDPVLAVVQYLQKKFPKSFKTSIDKDDDKTISKTAANNLQSQAFTSSRSPVNLLNTSEADSRERCALNQSQTSGIISIPTAGSAFRNLLQNDTSVSQGEPEINTRNLISLNRINQQTVRLGKNIQSNRDMIEEELIQPITRKSNKLLNEDMQPNPHTENLTPLQTQEEPPVLQLIKYKQRIRDNIDRRQHLEKLAELAKQAYSKEQILFVDSAAKVGQVQQQQQQQILPVESVNANLVQKPITKSKDEEDILNDEFSFQPRQLRTRNRSSRSRSNTSHVLKQHMGDIMLTMKQENTALMPMTLPIVCKVCGNIINNDENLLKLYNAKVSADPTLHSFEAQQTAKSVSSSTTVVDDWFEEADTNVSISSQQMSQREDAMTPQGIDLNLLQRNSFQPINQNTENTIRHRPPSSTPDGKTKVPQKNSPHLAGSDFFVPDSDQRGPRQPSLRNTSSPVIKKTQADSPVFTSNRSSTDITASSPLRRILESTLATTTLPTAQRRMSDWSVCEQSPDDSDES